MINWLKRRFVKELFFEVEANGSKCIMTPDETTECLITADDTTEYTIKEKWMTQSEYDSLPEFMGF